MKACDCPRCRSLCRNPGWFSPDDAKAAITAGLASKMMVDYLIGDPTIYVLCPASQGCERGRAPNTDELGGRFMIRIGLSSKGQCVLQRDGLCTIHDTTYKPTQCRSAMACEGDTGLDNYEMAAMWNNAGAQALVREWMNLVGFNEMDLAECY